MKTSEVIVVRFYLSETHAGLDALMRRLRDEDKVRGLTVFRGIAGFGESGKIHTAKLVDLSLDLPLVVEFFDTPEKIAPILDHLNHHIKPRHLLNWSAQVNE